MIRTVRGIRCNLLAALLLGGTATAWSVYVPLDGAVVAAGVTVVESNLRKVQHPTGGVVGTLNVREGQLVEAGEVVVRLDDTTTRANLGIVLNELTALRARLARLRAERDASGEPIYPDDLLERAGNEPDIAQVLEASAPCTRRVPAPRRDRGSSWASASTSSKTRSPASTSRWMLLQSSSLSHGRSLMI